MAKYCAILMLLFFACDKQNKSQSEKINHFETRNYVTVGRMFDSIKAPYIIDIQNKNKRIVFIGCEHQSDSTHEQFKEIERYFNAFKPQIAFNEGGQAKDSIHYATINEGIKKDGETGVLKYFADKTGIKMLNGDMSDSLEFATTTKIHSKEEMYVYYIVERIAVPYKYGAYGKAPFEQVFNEKIERYFAKRGFDLTQEEKTFLHFKNVYKKWTKQDFNIADFDIEAFDYVNDNCKFCAIGRTSKMVRDSVLLTKIDAALDEFDRVIVTFGHGHALAVEPALKQIINRKR
jgi:hypothetical protein